MKVLRLICIGLVLLGGCGALPEVTSPSTASPSPVSTEPHKLDQATLQPEVVAGQVVDENHQPVAGAVVRLQATEKHTVTDQAGMFQLEGVPLDKPASITAWAEGFFINNALATAEQPLVTIEVHRFSQLDNPNYEWLTSGNLLGEGENQGCAECHAVGESNTPFPLPVDEWLLDAHSQSALNPRFLTSYNGTNVHGNQSPPTTFILSNPSRHNSAGYNYVALAPDFEKPYFGPGYKLDFPKSAGNCSNCHLPGAAAKPNMNFAVDVNLARGVEKEGIFCDFCHKIWDVQLVEETGLPDADSPGVMSYTFRRPPEGHQFFAGPYDDVAPGEDTYSPLQQQSQYCAPCHFGVFWDTVVYNSFGEWLESPYSNPETGQTCQDCHMPSTGATLIALADAGANQRSPETVFSHLMPGAKDEEFLQNAVSVEVDASKQADHVQVQVAITNDNTGHHVPTDYPGRQLILLVQAYDENSDLLKQISGPVLPNWCGTGEQEDGYFAGLPGEAYAKILQEDWTGYFPTVAYWTPNTLLSDNRIGAFETAASEYVFENQGTRPVLIEVRLFLRRSFIELMDWKDWETPDMLMWEIELILE